MMVNFFEIYQIAVVVSESGVVIVIDNIPVDEFTYGPYISNVYDA